MLASVLHSEVAINVSIGIMRAFVEMRRFIANNALLFERISNVELKQLEYQKKTDEKLEQIFEYISDHEESNQKIFFDGQIYDAFSLLIGLIQKAEMEIVLVDGSLDGGRSWSGGVWCSPCDLDRTRNFCRVFVFDLSVSDAAIQELL